MELLQELRVAGLGVQVLFGFLLALPFTNRFVTLTTDQRHLYFAVLLVSALATAQLSCPVAYHRVVFRQHKKERLLKTANIMALSGLASVGVAISGAVLLVSSVVLHGVVVPVSAAVTAGMFVLLWLVVPIGGRFHDAEDGDSDGEVANPAGVDRRVDDIPRSTAVHRGEPLRVERLTARQPGSREEELTGLVDGQDERIEVNRLGGEGVGVEVVALDDVGVASYWQGPGRFRREAAGNSTRADRRCGRGPLSAGNEMRDRRKGTTMPRQDWSRKRERQYQHIKAGLVDKGDSAGEAEEIAARTVNKTRARAGETKTAGRSSLNDISSSRRGGLRSHRGAGGRTRQQLYEEARRKNIAGRSKMSKAQLERAVAR